LLTAGAGKLELLAGCYWQAATDRLLLAGCYWQAATGSCDYL